MLAGDCVKSRIEFASGLYTCREKEREVSKSISSEVEIPVNTILSFSRKFFQPESL